MRGSDEHINLRLKQKQNISFSPQNFKVNKENYLTLIKHIFLKYLIQT